MPQDAFTISHITNELSKVITDSKVNKINQPTRDMVVLSLYAKDGSKKLEISANASDTRIGLTNNDYTNPLTAPNFCMLLRKYLVGSVLTKIQQVAGERIIAITFDCKNEFFNSIRVVYIEIMGKYSNIILTENGTILGALKSSTLEEHYKRVLFSGAKYSYPDPQEKVNILDKEGVTKLLLNFNGGDIAKFVFENVSGLASSTANELCYKFFGNESEKLTEEKAQKFAEFLVNEYNNEDTKSCVLLINNEPKDFFSFECNGKHKIFNNIFDAQDYYYTYKENKKTFQDSARKLLSIIKAHEKKIEKKLALLVDRERECANMEDNKIKGELITANIYAIQKGQASCEVTNYYDETCPTIKIYLDVNQTPSQNAQRYYKKYNKQKRTIVAIEPQKNEALNELEYCKTISSSIENADSITDLKEIEEELIAIELIKVQSQKKPQKKAEIPFREFEIEGFKVYAGRNNIQNDRLLKFAKENDIWLHTQKYHSSHLIISINDKTLPDSVLLTACEICASLSDGKSGDKIPVDYCERKFVKKPSKSKAGLVNYSNFKTVLVTPNRHIDLEK